MKSSQRSNLQLEGKHWNIIHQILSRYSYQFYAYGSRVKGAARKFSDLDICYQEEIPLSVISQLREKFAESNLPFEVELVAWKHMRPAFREMIEGDLVLIN